MERLFEVKNHYPLDVFNSLVIGLQEANAHLMGHGEMKDHWMIMINFMYAMNISNAN